MSQTIDNKIVELQFNNQDFEKNVSTSISTLDRLKAALNLNGAAKGLDNINASSEKIRFNGLSNAIETVKNKFSLLDTAAFTTFQRMTNAAIDAGKKIADSLVFDNVQEGWGKYAEKTQAVGTLVAQGYDINLINDQLKRLNWYTDETSYNFTDMVNSIAKFTASGQGLEESVRAMEGIANWAALSGQSAQKASQAMYQLSQAMGSGVMRKEDFKSIQNVSMDTDEFRQKAIDTAIALGTLKQVGHDTYQSLVADSTEGQKEFTKAQFADSLTQGKWFTSDVMMEVYDAYAKAIDQIYKYQEEHDLDTASDAIKEMQELGIEVDEFGLKAFLAAQEARTFADVINSIKDAAGTVWMNIFETIFGDYETAKKLWTDMSEGLYDIFVTPLDSFQKLLEGAFGEKSKNSFVDMSDLLSAGFEEGSTELEAFQKVLIETAKQHGVNVDEMIAEEGSFADSLEKGWLTADILNESLAKIGKSGELDGIDKAKTSLEELHDLALKVIRGDYGNDPVRKGNMEALGLDYETTQKYVNLLWKITGHDWDKLSEATLAEADALFDNVKAYSELSDEQLKSQGYTEEEIKALRELAKAAEDTNSPLHNLMENLNRKSGRELFTETILTSIEKLKQGIEFVNGELAEIFPSVTSEHIYRAVKGLHDFVDGLGNHGKRTKENVAAIHTFTGALKRISEVFFVNKQSIGDIKDTLSGFGAVLEIVRKIIITLIEHAAGPLGDFIGLLLQTVLRITGAMGRFAVALQNALEKTNAYNRVIVPIVNILSKLANIVTMLGIRISGIVRHIFEALSGKLAPFVELFLTKLEKSKILSTLTGALDKVYNSILKFLREADSSKLENGIIGFFGKLIDIIGKFVGAIDTFNPADKITKLFAVIHDTIFGATVSGGDFGEALAEKASESFGDSLRRFFSSFVSSAINRNGEFSIGNLIKTVFAAIRDAIFGTTVSADDFGEGVETAIASGISSSGVTPGNVLRSALDGLANKIYTAIGNALNVGPENVAAVAQGIGGFVKRILSSIVGYLEDNDPFEVIMKGALILGVNKIIKGIKGLSGLLTSVSDLMGKVAEHVGGIIDAFAGVIKNYGDAIKTVADATAKQKKSEAFLNNAKGIALLLVAIAGAILLFSQIPEDQLIKAGIALAGVAGIIAGILIIQASLTKSSLKDGVNQTLNTLADGLVGAVKKFAKTAGIGIMFAGIAAALIGVAIAFVALSKYKWGSFLSTLGKILLVIAALGTAIVLVQKLSGGVNIGTALSLVSMALALNMLIVPLLAFGNMKTAKIMKGVFTITAILAALSGAFLLAGLGGKSEKNGVKKDQPKHLAATFIGMAVALNLMIPPLIAFGNMKTAKITKGILAVIVLMGAMAVAAKLATSKNKGGAKNILAMATALTTLLPVIVVFSQMKTSSIVKGVAVVYALLMALAGSAALAGIGNDSSETIKAMTKAIIVLVGAMAFLTTLDTGELLIAAITLSGVMLAFAGAVRLASTQVKGWAKLVLVGAMVGGLCVALSFLTTLDTGAMLVSAIALAGVITVLSLATRMSANSNAGWGKLLAMSVTVGAVAASLYWLAKSDTGKLLGAAITLSAVIGVLVLVMNHAGAITPMAMASIAVMTLAIGLISGCLYVLSQIPTDNLLATALSISAVLAVMVGGIALLGALGPGAIAGVLAFAAILAIIFGAIYLIGDEMGKNGSKLPTIAENFGQFIGKIINGIAKGMSDSLEKVGKQLELFSDSIKKVGDNLSGINAESFSIFGTLAKAMLEMTEAGFLDSITKLISGKSSLDRFNEWLPSLGEALSSYCTNIGSVDITGMADNIDAYGKLGEDMAALAKMIPKAGGLTQAFTGTPDYDGFVKFIGGGEGSIGLGTALKTYIEEIGVVDLTGDDGSNIGRNIGLYKNLADDMNDLANHIPKIGGLRGALEGNTDYEGFISFIGGGEGKAGLGTALKTYIEEIGVVDLTGDDGSNIGRNVNKYKDLADDMNTLANNIPNVGGFAGLIDGHPDYDGFIAFIGGEEGKKSLGDAMVAYVNAIGKLDLTGDDGSNIGKNVGKYKSIADDMNALAKDLPNVGGFAGLIDGHPDYDGFIAFIGGEEGKSGLGDALNAYCTAIAKINFNEDDTGKAKEVADGLIALNNALPEDGVIQKFTGGGLQLDTFGDNIKKFGEGLGDYYTALSNANINLSNILISSAVGLNLVDLAKNLESVKTSGLFGTAGTLAQFGGEISSFGLNLGSYYDHVKNMNIAKMEAITDFLNNFMALASVFTTGDLADFKAEDMNQFGQALSDLTAVDLTGFIDSIEKKTLEVKTAAEGFIGGFINAFKDIDATEITNAADSLVKSFSDAFKSTESVGSAGKNLIQAIADGISNNSSTVTSASTSLVSAIIDSLSSYYDRFKAVGSLMVGKIVNGFRTASYTANSAARALALAIYNTINAYRTSMRGVGTSLGSYFVNGVYSMTSSAYSAGDSVASSAVNGAGGHSMWSIGYNLGMSLAYGLNAALPSVRSAADNIVDQANRAAEAKAKIGSPSKVWIGYGSFMGQGLAIGLLRMQNTVSGAAEQVTMKANDTMTETVSKIHDMINASMDAQPVIRPVVDLSDVQAGMQAANSMFGFTPSMGVLTNLGSISASMNRRNQNVVTNEDVVNAVNSLKDVLGENRNNYYVNGVTYADTNKDIVSAIQTLIQFTTMEGRA